MKRKKFITSLGLLSGGLAMGSISNLYGSDSSFAQELAKSARDDEFWRIVRQQFVYPEDYIYLNTGGIGALPSLVINKLVKSLNEQEKFPRPGHSHDNWNNIKQTCTSFFGPDCKPEELALNSCATEGINIILNGLGLKSGDEIITSTHEHPAVHVPLINHHRLNGIVVKTFEPDMESGTGNEDRISKLITKKTKLIILSHITCTTGQIMPLKEIGDLAREAGVVFAVDGAQAPGSMEINLKDFDVDYYACSGHKWMLGPKRTGILYVPSKNLENLQPTTVGAYSDKGYDISNMSMELQNSAQRFEFGTQNEPLFIGLGAGAEFIKTIGLSKVQKHNRELAEKFHEGLMDLSGIRILSPEQKEYRSSMITFSIPGSKAQDISNYLAKDDAIRVRVVNEAGLNGVRVSFHVYNQSFEVDRILNKISTYLKK